MNITDLIGTVGVFLLLLAYFLNLAGKISKDGNFYIVLNVVGAGIAMLASIFLLYWPFIILEAMWTVVSIVALIRRITIKTKPL